MHRRSTTQEPNFDLIKEQRNNFMDGATRTLIPGCKIAKGNRPSLNTCSMDEKSGAETTKKITNVKWKGWKPSR
jgi:hypothetical protein